MKHLFKAYKIVIIFLCTASIMSIAISILGLLIAPYDSGLEIITLIKKLMLFGVIGVIVFYPLMKLFDNLQLKR
jgi:hypothetical protein